MFSSAPVWNYLACIKNEKVFMTKCTPLIMSLIIVVGIIVSGPASAAQQKVAADQLQAPTRVVTLGTGTPNIVAGRAGTATTVIVDQREVYLFDAGSGFMQTLGQFRDGEKQGIFPPSPSYPEYMYPVFLNKIFLTHLDSDHILGLPELLLRGWVLERDEPVQIWGPEGTRHLVSGIVDAYQPDIQHRLETLPISHQTPYKGKVTEFGSEPGAVYQDKYVTISAFDVHHGDWEPGMAVGYRIEAPDKTIVISGDTRPTDNLIKHARGADILLHEVMSQTGLKKLPVEWQDYMHAAHTTTAELGDIASNIDPRLLVMIHPLFLGQPASVLEREMKKYYQSDSRLAADGDVFE